MPGSEPLLSGSLLNDNLEVSFSDLRLPQREINSLRMVASELRLHRGETAFYEGDNSDALYMVISGVIRLTKLMPDGRHQIVGFGFSGDLIGNFIEGKYIYNADPIDNSLCWKFKKNDFYTLYLKDPLLRQYLFNLMYDDLKKAQDHMLILGRKSAVERVASFLLSLKDRIGSVEDGTLIIRLPMRREDVAAYTGLSVETVSRVFTRLREERVIQLITSSTIRVDKLDKLRRLTGEVGF